AAAPAANLGETVATVNGKAISKAELASLTEEIAARGMADRVTQTQLLDELIKRELLRQEAEAQHLENTQDTAARLANIHRAVLAHAAGQAYVKANPITDDMVKQEYDRQIGGSKATEFKARHILVKTEQEAKDIIKKLQAGAKFDELAKKHSGDPGSAAKGGDLGWFMPQQMVGPFSEAVIKLENGKFTTEPVKSDYGFHVILREDSRAKTPPPFEAVKDQLRDSLQNTVMQKHLEELQSKAKVVRNDAKPAEEAAQPAAEAAPAKEAEKPAAAPEHDHPAEAH
ncbi:peptidylprolyl isomerase, partial [Methylogaea oryzae]